MKCLPLNLNQFLLSVRESCERVTVCVFMVDNFLPLQFQNLYESGDFLHYLFCRKTGMSVIIQRTATDTEKKIQTM